MKTVRAWVRLGSGRRLNLLEPDPASWTHRDLAIGLTRTYRRGGHSRWSRPLSVAQHSLLVLALRQRDSLDHALASRYGLPDSTAQSYAAHKSADRLAAASEALHATGWPQEELADTLGIDVQPLVADPLAPPRGYLP